MSGDLRIWVDADSCPALVRNHTVKMATRSNIRTIFVANREVSVQQSGDFEMVICNKEKDAADNHIFENARIPDIVITNDILFASRLVSSGMCAINDRGTVFTPENVRERLSTRDFDMQLAQIGLVKHFHEGYDKKKFAKFAETFDRILHQQIRKSREAQKG